MLSLSLMRSVYPKSLVLLVAVAVGSGVLFLAAPSAAEPSSEPHTWSHFSFSAGLDYGISSGLHPFGFGLNARGGLTTDTGLYAGIVGQYFTGSESTDSRIEISPFSYSLDAWFWLAEIGYDWELNPSWVIRPKVGLGFAHWEYNRQSAGPETNTVDTDVAVSLGGQAVYPLGDRFQLSGELRYLFMGGPHSGSALTPGISFGSKL